MTAGSGPVTEGAPARRAAVHVDLDGASHIYRLRGWKWQASSDPVYETGVPRVLDVFDEYGIRATFFVIAEDLSDPTKADLLREIVGRGHDIGSHSLTHSPLQGLDEAAQRREIFDSRRRIEEELEVTPSGFRAPFFSIDDRALRLVEQAGYVYDSSMIPGRAVPGLASVPHRPGRLDGRALIEVPLPAHRPLPFPFHPSYSLVLGVRYFEWGIERFERSGAPFVLLFHLIDFAEPLDNSIARRWRQRLFTLSHIKAARKLAGCRRMLDRVLHSYTVTDTDRLLDLARQDWQRTSS